MNVLSMLIDAGLTLSTDGDQLVVVPGASITEELRGLIRLHKPDLLDAVRDAEAVAADLIGAIGRCCAVRGDDDRNRDALIAEAADLTPELQRDATQHFEQEAAVWAAATGRGAV